MANRLIPPPERKGHLVDVGCGTKPVFLLRTEFAVKIGLDKRPSGSLVKSIQNPDLCLAKFDIEKEGHLPLRSDSVDVVTMLAVLEHIEPERIIPLLAEVKRVLKPGGAFVLTTPAAWTDKLLRLMATLRLVSPLQIQDHKSAFSLKGLLALLRQVFPENRVRLGYFSMLMNLWAMARKESDTQMQAKG